MKSLTHTKVIRLKPGDKIAIECNEILTMKQIDEVFQQAKKAFPGFDVVVLPSNTKIKILRK